MALSTIIIEFREPKEPHKTYQKFNRDSLALQHKIDSARRAARYQAVRDSYALLKKQREQKKLAREMAYQAMMDSFAILKANRLKEKEEKMAERIHKLDSLKALKTIKLIPGETIELNLSDTLQLQRIPGIGKVLSKSIVNYRQKLGGFYVKEQLLEINGIPSSVLDFVTVLNGPFRKININLSTLNQLRNHPYIHFNQAKAIMDYRRKYGKINDIQQLSLIDGFTEEAIMQIKPYITY